jgi:predicted nucleotidyltransferase
MSMKLMLENLPPSLRPQVGTLRQSLLAFDQVMPLQRVYLFGSHARGEADSSSDVDLCLVSEGAERQLVAAASFRHALWSIWPRPSFTLVPITPTRLTEKKACGDHFFKTVLQEGICLAEEN